MSSEGNKPIVVLIEPDEDWAKDFLKIAKPHVLIYRFATCHEALLYVDCHPEVMAIVVSQDAPDPEDMKQIGAIFGGVIILSSAKEKIARNAASQVAWRWLRKIDSANLVVEYARAQQSLLMHFNNDLDLAVNAIEAYMTRKDCDALEATLVLAQGSDYLFYNRPVEIDEDGKAIITPFTDLGQGEEPTIEIEY